MYNLVIAARKDPETGELVDRLLSDGEWADIAETYLDRMGLAPRGDVFGVRWVAVRHADDHVHVVATLARQDGRRVFPGNDFYRAGEASREVEARYGLSVTASSDRTAAKRPTYAETQKAARSGQAEPVQDTLRRSVRTAAAGAASLAEFLERLRDDGLLVRERMSERNPGQSPGTPSHCPRRSTRGQPIFYGGGKLAADLTLPKLRRRWDVATPNGDSPQSSEGDRRTDARRSGGASSTSPAEGPAPGEALHRLTADERTRIWEQSTAAAARASEQVRAAGADPHAAADAAWAASDFLAAAARVVEGRSGGPLTAAAGEYDRAARELWGRVPAPSQAGQGLRAASVLLTSARFVGRNENKQLLALLAQLAALTDAVTRLRQSQDKAAQAAGSRRAADHLRQTSVQVARSTTVSYQSRRAAMPFDSGRSRPRTAPRAPDQRRGPHQ